MEDRSMTARAIFWDAVEKLDRGGMDRFLLEACGDNHDLRLRIERMLEVHDSDDSFMQVPAASLLGVGNSVDASTLDDGWIGCTVDRYRLLEKIGEGGMGAVFLANQNEPVQRQVAVKIIKSGLANQETIARFNVERRALALMDHPNIAKVFDGGTTDSGSPYLVMELVRGEPITLCCDTKRYTLDSRIRTFIQVCEAIQHAHQKGIIHRDLKPSNVLLKINDSDPVPTVIDFGVAKPIDVSRLEMETVTRISQMVGTPMYMSPEQTSEGRSDVDTRSDVYSLGAILYELLAGVTPFDKKVFRESSIREVQHLICDVDPPRPSARFQALDPKVRDEVAIHRQTNASSLFASLRRELDWITMKALEKDPTRRYQSPKELASDLQRFLNKEPVIAGPVSIAYRTRKAVQRHWPLLIAASVTGMSLIGGAFICLLLANQAWDAQRQAVANMTAANAAKLRFQDLAWRSGIERAYQSFELGQLAEADDALDQLEREDSAAKAKPEWQILRQELARTSRILLEINAPIHEVRLVPNTHQILAAGGNGNLYIVDWKTSECIRTISTGIPSLHALAVSRDGRRIAVGGVVDPVLDQAFPRIYDFNTGDMTHQLPGLATTIETLEFTSDGTKLVCGSRYEPIQIVDLETNATVSVPSSTRNQWVALSPKDNVLVSLSTVPFSTLNSIQLFELSSPFTSKAVNMHSPIASSFWLPGTERLVCLMNAGLNLQIIDPLEPARLLELNEVIDAECFAMGSNRQEMAAGLTNGEVVVWRLSPSQAMEVTKSTKEREVRPAFDENGAPVPTPIHPYKRYRVAKGPITSIEISDGIVFASSISGELRAVGLGDQNASALHNDQSLTSVEISSACWEPDGEFLLVGTHSGAILKTKNLSEWDHVDPAIGKHVTAVAISPDQKALAWVRYRGDVTLLREDIRRILQADSSEASEFINVENGITFSPDSLQIAWTGNLYLHIANVRDKDQPIRRFKMPGIVDCMAWSQESDCIYVGGRFSKVCKFDLQSGELTVLADVGSNTGALMMSETGDGLFSGHEDGSIRHWNLKTGTATLTYFHHSPLRSIVFSRDGRLGASADKDATIALWYVDNMERIGVVNSQPIWAGLIPVSKPSMIFSENDTRFQVLFELPDRKSILRTWQLIP